MLIGPFAMLAINLEMSSAYRIGVHSLGLAALDAAVMLRTKRCGDALHPAIIPRSSCPAGGCVAVGVLVVRLLSFRLAAGWSLLGLVALAASAPVGLVALAAASPLVSCG